MYFSDEMEAKIIEDELALRPEMNIDGRRTLRRVLGFLLSEAQPGNWAWRRLEDEFGFQGDFSLADHGEPPQGAKW